MVVGLVLIILAAAYFLTPANSLPSFLPGYDARVAKINYKHGGAALVVGVGCLAYALLSGRR